MNAPASGYAELSAEQRVFFEDNGYLVIKRALPPEVVGEVAAAVDEVHARDPAAGKLHDDGKFELRNCIVHHEAFFRLLDWPATAPLAWGNPQLEHPAQHFAPDRAALRARAGPRREAASWAASRRRHLLRRDAGAAPPHPAEDRVRHQRSIRPRLRRHRAGARQQPARRPAGGRSGDGMAVWRREHERRGGGCLHLRAAHLAWCRTQLVGHRPQDDLHRLRLPLGQAEWTTS